MLGEPHPLPFCQSLALLTMSTAPGVEPTWDRTNIVIAVNPMKVADLEASGYVTLHGRVRGRVVECIGEFKGLHRPGGCETCDRSLRECSAKRTSPQRSRSPPQPAEPVQQPGASRHEPGTKPGSTRIEIGRAGSTCPHSACLRAGTRPAGDASSCGDGGRATGAAVQVRTTSASGTNGRDIQHPAHHTGPCVSGSTRAFGPRRTATGRTSDAFASSIAATCRARQHQQQHSGSITSHEVCADSGSVHPALAWCSTCEPSLTDSGQAPHPSATQASRESFPLSAILLVLWRMPLAVCLAGCLMLKKPLMRCVNWLTIKKPYTLVSNLRAPVVPSSAPSSRYHTEKAVPLVSPSTIAAGAASTCSLQILSLVRTPSSHVDGEQIIQYTSNAMQEKASICSLSALPLVSTPSSTTDEKGNHDEETTVVTSHVNRSVEPPSLRCIVS